jgi:hypothetical protein
MKKKNMKQLALLGVLAGCAVAAQSAAQEGAINNYSAGAILAAHGCASCRNVAENDDEMMTSRPGRNMSQDPQDQEPARNGCSGKSGCNGKSNGKSGTSYNNYRNSQY